MNEIEKAIATHGEAAITAWIEWAEAHNGDPENEFAAFLAGRASVVGAAR